MESKLCHSCNKAINRPPSLTRGIKNFCNHECYSKAKRELMKAENNPRWSGGEDKLNCKFCSKPYQRKKYGDKQNKYCSMKCSVEDKNRYNKAEQHWNWKGGTSTRYRRKFHPKPDKCQVCKALGSSFKKGLQFDHDHKTDKFRGWLCTNCNTTLGLVKDNPRILEALVTYLINNENSL